MEEIYMQISKAMFKNADELYKEKERIREEYQKLDCTAKKEIYKWWFFFYLSQLKNPLKELLWDFLNYKCVDARLDKEYIKFCEKRRMMYHVEEKTIDNDEDDMI